MALCNSVRTLILAVAVFSAAFCVVAADVEPEEFDLADGNSTTSNTTTTAKPTTTQAASTSTKAAPSTSPASTPRPAGEPTYSLKDDKGNYCMVLQANIDVMFNTSAGQMVKTSVPYQATPSGGCHKSDDVMTFEWEVALDNETDGNVTLTLKLTATSTAFQLSQITLVVSGGESETFSANVTDFKTSIKSYYKCDDMQTVSADNMTVEFSKLKLIAFSSQTSSDFSKYNDLSVNDCKANSNKTDTIVPIAVGCALAVMVLIVLIGYCIGRRRTRPGYQQMAE